MPDNNQEGAPSPKTITIEENRNENVGTTAGMATGVGRAVVQLPEPPNDGRWTVKRHSRLEAE